MTEIRKHATPLYPGSFFPEEGQTIQVPLISSDLEVAKWFDSEAWFAIEVTVAEYERWSTESGDEKWEPVKGTESKHRIYVGQVLDVDAVRATVADPTILLSNMRGNGWDRMVKTRRGNFQPLMADDTVLERV